MRLLTRSSFDGLACAAILKELGIMESWKFAHPKDIQDGLVEVTDNDILAGIPFIHGCKMWFDHHTSEIERLRKLYEFEGETHPADSTARVIYEYFKGEQRLPQFKPMLDAVDKLSAAKLTVDEILEPTGWVLLGFIMDPRTGLGRFHNFRISNYELMEYFIDICRTLDIDDILKDPDVKERIDLYFSQAEQFRDMLQKHTRLEDNVIITDLRGQETIYIGNRFLLYYLYPQQNISLWIVDGRNKQNCPIAIGHSIFNRTSNTDVGSLLLSYGGGGHRQVGTCQVPYEEADRVIGELLAKLKADG